MALKATDHGDRITFKGGRGGGGGRRTVTIYLNLFAEEALKNQQLHVLQLRTTNINVLVLARKGLIFAVAGMGLGCSPEATITYCCWGWGKGTLFQGKGVPSG